jgi:hypothetical protein
MDDTGSYQTEAVIRSDENFWEPFPEISNPNDTWIYWLVTGIIGLRLVYLVW